MPFGRQSADQRGRGFGGGGSRRKRLEEEGGYFLTR